MWGLRLGPFAQDLRSCELCTVADNGYKKKIREMTNAWKQIHRMKGFAEYLQVVQSDMEIIKQDFEKRNSELGKKIEQLEEEKLHLRLDMDFQKLETEKLRKGKNKAEKDLDSSKIDYKKLRLSMRTAGLGKTSKQWHQEIREENNKADRWERSLHYYQNRNTAVKLRASLSKIEEIKRRVEELETALQNCEIQIEFFEAKEECQKEQLHFY
ncbi:hypothetical protein Golob_024424 [Gossypium lobatum]|uniref:Uncharacterized protein n=1 Tax=Gossypium lobatum TaxID=34289 RepID=A0A7J8NDG6_9ROSI|nr:hypothetical protein [Gossypium lobatum]